MNQKLLSLLLVVLCAVNVYAQPKQPKPSKKGQKQYQLAKASFNTEKYAEAVTAFQEVYKNPKNHSLRADALFLTAVSHQRNKNLPEARQTVEKLIGEFPDFRAKEEALYLLADIQFKQNETEKALQTLDGLQDNSLISDASNMKGKHLRELSLEALRAMFAKRPKDAFLAQMVVDKIAAQSTNEEEVEFMEQLVRDMKLEKPASMRFERKLYTKPAYKIAVLFPFDAERMKKRDTTTLSRVFVSMYQGMRIAQKELDTLKGVKVHLLAYEIASGDKTKLANLLRDKEFADIDAFVGPIFDSLQRVVAEILPTQKSILINPIALDAKMINNAYTYLYESTPETQATKIVEFIGSQTQNKNMIILYDDLRKNKNLATLAKQKAEAQGFKVVGFEEVSISNLSVIRDLLEKYNNFELGSMLVSSSSASVAEEVVKRLNEGNFAVPVIVPEAWLRMQGLEYEVYEKLKIHIIAPEYLDNDAKVTLRFKRAYTTLTRQENQDPPSFAFTGYEIVHYLAQVWSIAGTQTNYNKVLQKISPYQSKTGDWLQYTAGRQDNQFVPILRFEKKESGVELEIANKPK